MTAKEYLSQAYHIDCLINSKLEQLRSMYDMATKANASLTDTPSSATRNIHQMEDCVCAIVDLRNSIEADVRSLVDLKQKIVEAIQSVDDPKCRTVLELRYLSYKHWDEITDLMGYESRYVFKIHNRALKKMTLKETKRQLSRFADSKKS